MEVTPQMWFGVFGSGDRERGERERGVRERERETRGYSRLTLHGAPHTLGYIAGASNTIRAGALLHTLNSTPLVLSRKVFNLNDFGFLFAQRHSTKVDCCRNWL